MKKLAMIVGGILSVGASASFLARGVGDYFENVDAGRVIRQKLYEKNNEHISRYSDEVELSAERVLRNGYLGYKRKKALWDIGSAVGMFAVGYVLLRRGTQKEPIKIVKFESESIDEIDRVSENDDSFF